MIDRSLLVVCLVSALAAGFARADAAAFDIVGLRLGMTGEEALAALEAHDPNLAVSVENGFFQYSDGVEYFETEEFLSKITAQRQPPQQAVPAFMLFFAPPPNGGRLWAIERRERIEQNPPSLAQYTAALEQKYGKPTAVSPGGASLSWDLPDGRISCIPRDPSRPGFPTYRPSKDQAQALLFTLQAANQRNPSPPDYRQCGSHLFFILSESDGVVTEFQSIMFDVGYQVSAAEAAEAQVASLEDAARKARESKGQTPAL